MDDRYLAAIDDERRIRVGLERKLRNRYGGIASISVYASAEEFLDGFNRTSAPLVLITDVRMPGMDGIALIERMLKPMARVKAIALSGFDDYSYVRSALTLGAIDYLLKPVSNTDLYRAIENAFDALGVPIADGSIAPTPGISREALVQCVDQYLYSELGVNEIANRLRITPSYASARFRKLTGKTITAYVRERRIDRARRLLEDPAISIKEVSAILGYRFPHHFAREFRRVTGQSPTEYRRGI